MKTASDPRHIRRREIVKELFVETYSNLPTASQDTKEILSKRKSIDAEIVKAAPAWPIDKLNRIDLAILRLAVYEMQKADTPPKVVIDEAVELAKEFGSENSSSFINGVLGTIYKMTKLASDIKPVKNLLADQLGIEPDDIEENYSFIEDLHMSPSEVSDFIETLEKNGYDTSALDLSTLETFSDLEETLSHRDL